VKVANSVTDFAALRAELDGTGERIVYVPTMGALHAGHRSLIALAKSLGSRVVISIFVNPLQFGPGEDYARYPRPLEEDLEICRLEGVDLVLVPTVAELYPAGRQVTVHAGPMGQLWEGRARPGHFDGVLTVVLKLLHVVRPHIAIFGQKDAQQLACIQRMVLDLNLDVTVLGGSTLREPDGLAMSSRNVFLSAAERVTATALSRSLAQAATQTSVPAARAVASAVLDQVRDDPGFELDYATLVHPTTFVEVSDDYHGDAVFIVAARVGMTRLIDNAPMTFPAPLPVAEPVPV
jgi:pantoate--beta-alanine ligase